jgi:hypothetical protein
LRDSQMPEPWQHPTQLRLCARMPPRSSSVRPGRRHFLARFPTSW